MGKAVAIPDDVKQAIQAATTEFALCVSTPMTPHKERYLRELVAVTRAAAIGSDYGPAIKGYEAIGRALGHIVDKQEVTHRAGSLADAPDEKLVEILRSATVIDPPPPATPAPKPMTEAEAEALLYA